VPADRVSPAPGTVQRVDQRPRPPVVIPLRHPQHDGARGPVGQLDGGHVAYAILGRRQRKVAAAVIALLFVLGVIGWSGWLIWVALLVLLGIYHPPVVYEWVTLDRKRRVVGWMTLALFVATFTPVPF
ncbi:MAG TPA: hypothetical protein P5244_05080, partial [Syntrophales bacterium]|nr:hypothetical protein [Syntrophales bacterium]